jgi:hypothetical protein
MYWWQWVLQITGAWFYLGLIVLALWHWVISRGRKRNQVTKTSAPPVPAKSSPGRRDNPASSHRIYAGSGVKYVTVVIDRVLGPKGRPCPSAASVHRRGIERAPQGNVSLDGRSTTEVACSDRA